MVITKSSTTFVAFLRGIGPSNPNMKNAKLRAVFESLGYHNVRSVISSGNIIFETPKINQAKLEQMIQAELKAQLGIAGGTIVRSADEIKTLLKTQPFKGLEHTPTTYLTVTFTKDRSAAAKMDIPYQSTQHNFRVISFDSNAKAIYCITDITSAKTPDVMGWLEKQYGKDITTRTWKSIERIGKRL